METRKFGNWEIGKRTSFSWFPSFLARSATVSRFPNLLMWLLLQFEIVHQVADVAQVAVGLADDVEQAQKSEAEALRRPQVGGIVPDRQPAARDESHDAD